MSSVEYRPTGYIEMDPASSGAYWKGREAMTHISIMQSIKMGMSVHLCEYVAIVYHGQSFPLSVDFSFTNPLKKLKEKNK